MNPSDAKRRADQIVGKRVDKLGRAAGLEILRRVIRRNPVDTGHSRGNWNVKVGGPDTRVVDGRTESVALAAGSATIQAFKMSDGQPLHVTNAVPYIIPLEEGWSKQAPQGMARLTVAEMKPVVERIAETLNRG